MQITAPFSWQEFSRRVTLQLVSLFCCALPAVGGPIQFFVSPKGSDKNPGSAAKPFASLERARSAVRDARKSPREPVSVTLLGGDYLRTNHSS